MTHRAEFGVLCNLGDLMSYIIEPFIRPPKQICDREQTSTAYFGDFWRDTCTKSVFYA